MNSDQLAINNDQEIISKELWNSHKQTGGTGGTSSGEAWKLFAGVACRISYWSMVLVAGGASLAGDQEFIKDSNEVADLFWGVKGITDHEGRVMGVSKKGWGREITWQFRFLFISLKNSWYFL